MEAVVAGRADLRTISAATRHGLTVRGCAVLAGADFQLADAVSEMEAVVAGRADLRTIVGATRTVGGLAVCACATGHADTSDVRSAHLCSHSFVHTIGTGGWALLLRALLYAHVVISERGAGDAVAKLGAPHAAAARAGPVAGLEIRLGVMWPTDVRNGSHSVGEWHDALTS